MLHPEVTLWGVAGTTYERDFSTFWSRKLPRLIASLPGWEDRTHRDPLERARRRRLVAWVEALYGGDQGEPLVSVSDMVELVTATAVRARGEGRRVDRLVAGIPVATHRAWCAGLTAFTNAGGWPHLDGVEVLASCWAEPPDDWRPGMPAMELDGDRVTITARHRWPPLVDRYVDSSLPAAAWAIYGQLCSEGWLRSAAADAAALLGIIGDDREP